MLKPLMAALAALLLLSCATAPETPSDAAYALAYVCRVQALDCSEIQPPAVSYVNMPYLGLFSPGLTNTVLLNPLALADEPARMAVLIHETTHYVDYQLGRLGDHCVAEGRAFAVQNLWLFDQELSERAVWTWQAAYNPEDCTP